MYSRPNCAKALVSPDGKTRLINNKPHQYQAITSTIPPETQNEHEKYTSISNNNSHLYFFDHM